LTFFSVHDLFDLLLCVVEKVDPPRVLVICCSNSQPHVKAVRTFVKFLEAKCDVSVIVVDNDCMMPLESVHDWLMREIELAKQVILFHSADSVALAWHGIRSTAAQSVALMAFMTVLEMFSKSRIDPSKLVNVYFSYTSHDCVVDISCGQTFQLMNEFDNFVTSIQGHSGNDNSSLFMCNGLCTCVRGRKLEHAIRVAAADAAKHPNRLDFKLPDDDTESIATESLMSCLAAVISSGASDTEIYHVETSTAETEA